MARRTQSQRTRPRQHEEAEDLTFGQSMERRGIKPSRIMGGRRVWTFNAGEILHPSAGLNG